jgi:hypothetical protein
MSGNAFILVITLAAMTACTQGVSNAQDSSFATKGIWEVAGTVALSSYTSVSNGETGDAITIFTFAPQVGYFVGNGFELALGTGIALLPGVSIISPEEGESITLTQLFFAPSYNFRTSGGTTFPFIEGMIGYTSMSSGSDDVSGVSYGARGGE